MGPGTKLGQPTCLPLSTMQHLMLCFFFFNLFFNWRKIALQCCVGFCHTTRQFSHNYTFITSLLSLPALPPPLPSRSYLQGRNGDIDIENKLMDTVGEESGMNGESSIDIHTLPCVKQMTGEKLIYYPESTAYHYASSTSY